MAAAPKKKTPAKAAAPKPAAKPKTRKASTKPTHKQGAGAATPALAGNSREQSGEVRIPLNDIAPSPLNPRKTFTEESIAELAGSLAAVGQLQNVTLRKVSDKSPRYHLIMGERRFRAMKLLAADGRWPDDAPVRALIMDVDDATHLELAIEENERREDVHPLEQAEAYAKLAAIREKETGDETAAATLIAERTGQSRRNIQYYLQCARHLTPEMKEAWTIGWIPTRKLAIACARYAPDLQKEILYALEFGEIRNEKDLKEWLTEIGYSAEFAVFDIEDYIEAGGALIEADAASMSGPTLLDKALFLKLQAKAVEAKAKELSAQHKLKSKPQKLASYYKREDGVKIVDGARTMPDDAFVLYGLHPHTAEAWIHVVSPSAKKPVKATATKPSKGGSSETAAAEEPAPQEYARKNWIAGAAARTRTMRQITAASPQVAIALTIVSLSQRHYDDGYDQHLLNIQAGWTRSDTQAVQEALGTQEGLDIFAGVQGFEGDKIKDRKAAMAGLLALSPEDLLARYAAMIARLLLDTPNSHKAGPGSTSEACAIAYWAASNANAEDAFQDAFEAMEFLADAAWFGDYTTAQLRAIYFDCGAALREGSNGAPPDMKRAELAAWMAEKRAAAWVPPEARFLDRDAMAAAVETLLKGGKA